MHIVVIGLGSMGKRRIRLLKQYIKNEICEKNNQWRIYGVDFLEERRKEVENKFKIDTYGSLEECIHSCPMLQCAIVSTSPHTHAKIITSCLEANLHVFTEINLISEGYQENINLAKNKKRILFLSSTPMYQKEMIYLKKILKDRNFAGTYRYYVGQYLPEWHPWENYNEFFVGRKDTNGCREIFAIELPWMIDTFGKIKNIKTVHNKISDLAINYDDSYHVLIEHESGIIGEMSVDVVIPQAERNLKIWGEHFELSWNGTAESLKVWNHDEKNFSPVNLYECVDHEEGYNEFIEENSYYEELVNFIGCVEGNEVAKYSFEKDLETLRVIDEIEK